MVLCVSWVIEFVFFVLFFSLLSPLDLQVMIKLQTQSQNQESKPGTKTETIIRSVTGTLIKVLNCH